DLVNDFAERVHRVQEALGERLFDEGRADIIDARDGLLRAAVDSDGLRYKVKVTWDTIGQSFACSCGTDVSRICEHVWAAVITAEADGYYDANQYDRYGSYRPTVAVGAAKLKAAAVKKDRPPRWKSALKK